MLLYPVRYAVACPNGKEGVPGLSGNFQITGGPSQVLPAKYTLRALRPGYLYTYEEKRKRLKAYIVLPRGALWEFPLEYAPVVDPDLMDFCCLNRVSVALSYCIDIEPLPGGNIGNIWIGWSNVLWTKNVIAQVANESWRKKHLQCINAEAMMRNSASHAASFQKSSSEIPHFSSDEAAMKKAFDFSSTSASRDVSLRDKHETVKKVLEERCPYGGFVVAVNDPVGITNDLSELTSPTYHAGLDEQIYRGHICRQLINSLERSVRDEARANAKNDIIRDRAFELDPEGVQGDSVRQVWKLIKAGGLSKYEEQQRSDKKKYGSSQEGILKAAEEHAWKEFTSHADGTKFLDFERVRNFPHLYIDAVKKFEPTALVIADRHCSWLQSEQLSNWMSGMHDSSDIRSGYAYRESVAQCIGNAITTDCCQAQLERWLKSGDLSDHRNLMARALLYNHDEIINTALTDIRGSDFKPKYVLSLYKQVIVRVPKNEANRLIDRFVLTTAGLLARSLGQAQSLIMRNLVLAGLVLQGRVIIRASNLNREQLINWLLRTTRDQGFKLDQSFSESYANARKEVRRVLRKYPTSPVACAFEIDVDSLEAERKIKEGSLKIVKIPDLGLVKQWFASSDVNTGVVGVVLQLLALYFINADRKRVDEFDRTTQELKVAVASLAVGASVVEAAATAFTKLPDNPLSKFVVKQWKFSGSGLKSGIKVAKFFGATASCLSALFDIKNACGAFEENDVFLSAAYAVNAGLAIGLAVAGFAWAASIYWPLFIAAFCLGIFISAIRPSALKKWLSRCYFIVDAKGREEKQYTSLDEELIAFNNAVGA